MRASRQFKPAARAEEASCDNKKRARSGPALAITDVSASIHSAVSWASVSMGRNRCSGEVMSIGMQSVTVVAGWWRLWSWRQREHRKAIRSLLKAIVTESLRLGPQNVLLKICHKLRKTA
jgi:hypothetical protein